MRRWEFKTRHEDGKRIILEEHKYQYLEKYWKNERDKKSKLTLEASAYGLELALSGSLETNFIAVLGVFLPFPEVIFFSFFALGVEATFG